ncbi:MAG: O-antigen ligase family protein [bacterium]|nr:O-antigen ligase family protein [bacterium]
MILSERTRVNLFYLLFLVTVLLTAQGINQTETATALKIAAGCAIIVISIVKFEAALYLLIFSMLLSPELRVAAGGGRDVILRVDDVLLVIIGLSWLGRMALLKEVGLIRKTPINRAILIYAVVCVFSTTLGIWAGRVRSSTGFFYVLKYLEYFVVYFLIVNHLRSENQVRRFVWAILITGVLISIYGMIQIPAGVRVSAPFEGQYGEPNTLGGYLLLLIAIVSGLFLTARTEKRKLFYLGMAVLFSIPFIYTLSRTSWLALIPMIGTLLYFSYRKTILVYFVILAVAVTLLLAPQSARDRVLYTFKSHPTKSIQVAGITLDPSSSDRIVSWQQCVRDFVNHPLLGYGVTGYGFIDGQYFRTLVEIGLIGLGALFYLMYVIFREVLSVYRQADSTYYRGLALGLLAGCAAMYTHAVGSNTFIIVRIMEPFWFLTGLVIMLPRVVPEDREAAA